MPTSTVYNATTAAPATADSNTAAIVPEQKPNFIDGAALKVLLVEDEAGALEPVPVLEPEPEDPDTVDAPAEVVGLLVFVTPKPEEVPGAEQLAWLLHWLSATENVWCLAQLKAYAVEVWLPDPPELDVVVMLPCSAIEKLPLVA